MMGLYLPDPGPSFKLNPRIITGALWRFDFDTEQSAFSAYIEGGRKDSSFVARMQRRHWDTTRLSPAPLANFLYVYSGWDAQGDFLIIPDRDHNKDFNDDSVSIYQSALYQRNRAASLPYEIMHVPIWQTATVHDVMLTLRFVPGFLTSLKMSDHRADTAKIFIDLYEYASGQARIDGKEQSFYVAPNGWLFYRQTAPEKNRVFITNDSSFEVGQQIPTAYLNKIGDTIPIENSLYGLDAIDWVNNTLTIHYAGVNTGLGIVPGTIAKNFTAENILTHKPVSLSGLKGNYVLLDFWGTWCGPCKETTPDLKKLHTDYPDLEMVSIALDDKLASVVDYVKNEGVSWTNIFEDRQGAKAKIADAYNIQNYPTFILIDKKGRIIFRNYGLPGFADLKKILPPLFTSR
jgi:thiol-disulfide isomerase/thioredoxin